MATRVIREPEHIDKLAALLKSARLPITVSWSQGAPRTQAQNRLAFRYYQDIAHQMGDRSVEEARAECKVVFAAPILCQESAEFRDQWERLRVTMTHEALVDFVRVTQLPMTSIMTVKPMTAYMEAVERHWTQAGVRLTHPDDMKWQDEFR